MHNQTDRTAIHREGQTWDHSSMSSRQGAKYHTKCTGQALATVESHPTAKADEYGEGMTLYGANFCPFVQRVWMTLEVLGDVGYRYAEIDPYKKPKELLDVNPKGLVPALRIGDTGKCLAESTVVMEYLHDRYASSGKPLLLPPRQDAYERARQRLAADKVNRALIPAFYRYLQAQDADQQIKLGQEYVQELKAFEASMLAEEEGAFWDGSKEIGFVDVMVAPWILRSVNVLKFYRGLEVENVFDQHSRFQRFKRALFEHPAFKATTSTEDLYLDSYARYAENRPNTSQVADAINSGREYACQQREIIDCMLNELRPLSQVVFPNCLASVFLSYNALCLIHTALRRC